MYRYPSRTDREDDHGEEGKVEDQEVEKGESQEDEENEKDGCCQQEEARSTEEKRREEAGQKGQG
jgi:hypothetical protein